MSEITSLNQFKSCFKVSFSNGQSFLLLPEVVYSRSLREGGNYDENTISSIIAENNDKLCFEALLKILKTRMHSTGELRKKLLSKKFSRSTIENTIKKALESGVTNDDTAGEFYKNELLAKGYGSIRIRDSLARKGFSTDMVDKFSSEVSENSDSELENAQKIFEKKLIFLKKNKSLDARKIKERLFRFMQSKGYPSEIIFSLMKDFSE